MPKRIVYTRPDGGVAVCAPSLTALRFMTGGGGRWDGYSRGFLDRQIAKQSEECGERNAHRFVMAMQFGGCTDAEAYELMRDRFCAHHGSGIELWDVDDVPSDRWFRDAWVRSHNGGPIDVSLRKARRIQFRRINDAVEAENNRRRQDINLFDRPIAPDWPTVRDAIRGAVDVADLRRIWPSELLHPVEQGQIGFLSGPSWVPRRRSLQVVAPRSNVADVEAVGGRSTSRPSSDRRNAGTCPPSKSMP